MERRLARILHYVLECMDKTPGRATAVVLAEYHNPDVAEGVDEDADEPAAADEAAAAAAAPPPAEGAQQPPAAIDNEVRGRRHDVH